MLVSIALFILAILVFVLDIRREKQVEKLRQSNIDLRISNKKIERDISKKLNTNISTKN